MNTPNNRRRKESRRKIEQAFMELLQAKDLPQISVSEVCKLAGVNRTTFYANYPDVYGLADAIRKSLEDNLQEMFAAEIRTHINSNDYLRLFRHIYENQIFYQTYFKLGYDNNYRIWKYDTHQAEQYFNNRFVKYHGEFFRAGITRIIKLWLEGGCQETPEEMEEIIKSEYQARAV